jgi:tagatose 1,6-diphosphate aldolase
MRFVFLDPGPLIDNELQLVAPDARWFDEVLAATAHPLTVKEAPHDATMTRQKLHEFLTAAPFGRQPGDPATHRVPAYHFWLRLSEPAGDPPIHIAGGLGLRIGVNREIELYSGNIGYHVYPPARGHHYAERACRLVLPLARRHGMEQVWITVNPDNWPSRRTCERLGATLIDVVPIPKDHPFRTRGETAKCRYLLDLTRAG